MNMGTGGYVAGESNSEGGRMASPTVRISRAHYFGIGHVTFRIQGSQVEASWFESSDAHRHISATGVDWQDALEKVVKVIRKIQQDSALGLERRKATVLGAGTSDSRRGFGLGADADGNRYARMVPSN
jgi:hypothetical protein